MIGLRRRVMASVALGFVAAALAGPASAQPAFPTKPITFVVNFPPGGPSDILARLIGVQVTAALGQPVVVDNKAGATGAIGATAVAKSAPDGHTVLFAIDSLFTVTPTLLPGQFDPASLKPVMLMASSGLTLAVNPVVPADRARTLVALGRYQELSFASGGNGSPGHLAAAILKDKTGLKVLHVPYRGNTPAVLAVVQGEAQAGVLATPGFMPHVRSGKLRALLVTGAARSVLLPDVPTVHELQLPELAELALEVLYLAYVPAATPDGVVAVLARAFQRALEQPELRERLDQLDMVPVLTTGDAVTARLAALRERYAPTIRATGMTAD
jgi:tripartite-type tricarboxylate transporter receptor subunit TctC